MGWYYTPFDPMSADENSRACSLINNIRKAGTVTFCRIIQGVREKSLPKESYTNFTVFNQFLRILDYALAMP